jgi:hypothetical protein
MDLKVIRKASINLFSEVLNNLLCFKSTDENSPLDAKDTNDICAPPLNSETLELELDFC